VKSRKLKAESAKLKALNVKSVVWFISKEGDTRYTTPLLLISSNLTLHLAERFSFTAEKKQFLHRCPLPANR